MKSKTIYVLVGDSGKFVRHNKNGYSVFATSLKSAKEMLWDIEIESNHWTWGLGKIGSFDTPYRIKKIKVIYEKVEND